MFTPTSPTPNSFQIHPYLQLLINSSIFLINLWGTVCVGHILMGEALTYQGLEPLRNTLLP